MMIWRHLESRRFALAYEKREKVYFSWQTERALLCICIQYLTQAIFTCE